MKEFLAAKNKEFEKRLHEADSQILKCKEEIIVFKYYLFLKIMLI